MAPIYSPEQGYHSTGGGGFLVLFLYYPHYTSGPIRAGHFEQVNACSHALHRQAVTAFLQRALHLGGAGNAQQPVAGGLWHAGYVQLIGCGVGEYMNTGNTELPGFGWCL